MHFIDGKALAAQIRAQTKEDITSTSVQPTLAILLVGEDPASHLYVSLKEKAAAEVGVKTIVERKPSDVTDGDLIRIIQSWNNDPSINAILVQIPLPPHHNEDHVIEAIDPKKDVDGFHPTNRDALLAGNVQIVPPVHEGILRLIASTDKRINGTKASLIMNSNLFADPLKKFLTSAGVDVTIMSPDDLYYGTLSEADIVVVAVGRPNFLNVSMTKQDVVIIDVGTNKQADGKIIGDVNVESYKNTDAWISPVPGGVGPMTIAQLLKNVVQMANVK